MANMNADMPARQRTLLIVTAVCALVFVTDLVIINVWGELPSGWWVLAVPVGLVLVPVIGVGALALLLLDRRRA